ncbi:patatin-like phospholipase family protein [Streptomyces mirabilis]|nr:patatin-like phospholipase family protein [Streptomyces mirabilis]
MAGRHAGGAGRRGLDLGDADVLAGTSAGSLLAVELAAGAAPADLYEVQVARKRAMMEVDFTFFMTVKYLWAALGSRDPATVVRRLGRLSLNVRDVTEADVFDAIRPQLPVQDWPERPVRLFAVDALTGEPTGFSADSGVDLVTAMSATCALPPLFPPITIGAGRWMDGGVRSTTNADLARDCRRVVVLAPIPDVPGATPSAFDQVASRGGRYRAALLVPDRAARRAFGRNALDASRIPGAARAGLRQAAEYAEEVRAVWHG